MKRTTCRAALFLCLLGLGCATTPATPTAMPMTLAPPTVERSATTTTSTETGMSEADIRAFFRARMDATRDIPTTKHSFEAKKNGVLYLITVEDEYLQVSVPIAPLYTLSAQIRFELAWRLLQANFARSGLVRYSVMGRIFFATGALAREDVTTHRLASIVVELKNMYTNALRNGPNGYSSRTPDPNEKDVDPNKDPTLTEDEWFERQTIDPSTPPPEKKPSTGPTTEM